MQEQEMQNRVLGIWMPTVWRNRRHTVSLLKNSIFKISLLWCQLREIGTNVASWTSCFALNFFTFPSLHPSRQLNQTSTFSKTQYSDSNQKKMLSLSHFSQSAGNFVTSFENKVDSILEHSPSGFLNNSSNFNDFGLSLTLLLIQCHSPAYIPTLPIHSVSWLLWSSPTDIKLHTIDHQAIVNSSSQGFRPQAIWHLKLQTLRFTSFHFYPKLSDMPAYSISFTEQPVGSQPHCPSMKCDCASTTVKTSTWKVSANKLDYHFISITLFREFSLLRVAMADLKNR